MIKIKKFLKLLTLPLIFSYSIFASPHYPVTTNVLISSGNLADIENTPIYSNEGIAYSVGGVGNVVFDITARLQSTLIKLDSGQSPAVKNNWSTTEEYEEWTDRLILRKTTNFYVLDGAQFAQSFNGSDNFFDPNHNSVTNEPLELQDINVLVQNFIDAGGHLELYEEARDAGNIGVEALISELKLGRGPITIVETVEFSRLVKSINNPNDAYRINILKDEPIAGKEVNGSDLAAIKDSRLDSFVTGTTFSVGSAGITSYNQKMLNGFTVGNEWEKKLTYDKRWMYFKTSAFAGFGLGLRIPWTADVKVSERLIPRDDPDRTNFEASIEVATLDADTDFYESVGVPAEHRYRGKEMPLEAAAGITLKIRVLGATIIDKDENDPVVGKDVDMSEDFDPPLGPTPMNIATLEFPYEDTRLAYSARYAGVGADFKADVGIRGDSIDLRVKPFNSWNRDGLAYSKNYRNISLTNQGTPISLSYAVDDNSADENQYFYNFGPIYSRARYQTSLTITPKARIRCTLYLSEIWGSLSDINFNSNWHSLFTAAFNLPSLGPHDGVDSEIRAVHNSRRLLPIALRATPHRFTTNPSAGIWDYIIGELGDDSLTLIEYIPDDYNVVSESITGGGVYDSNERSITWSLAKGSVPDNVSYRSIYSGSLSSSAPNPVGSFQSTYVEGGIDMNINAAIGDIRYESTKEAEADLANYRLSRRPTIEAYDAVVAERDARLTTSQVRDLKLGSSMLAVEDGNASLNLELEATNSLASTGSSWAPVPESKVIVHPTFQNGKIKIDVQGDDDTNTGVRFFRFVMEGGSESVTDSAGNHAEQ